MMFAKLGLAEPILRAVAAEGYTIPTPIQSQAIPCLLDGRDLLGCAQTGTGKTAAFALPILHRLANNPRLNGLQPPKSNAERLARPVRVLVLAPTRELAVQIGDSFAAYGCYAGMRHTVVYGGVAQGPQTRALRQGVEILIATPGRLIDLMGQQYIDLASVETFVLDEADRMLDMGFMPDVRRILARLPSRRQTVLFCATMPEPIQRLADAILRDPVEVRIAPVAETTELIEESVFFVPRARKPGLLAKLLSTGAITRALVFTRTKHGADKVVEQLRKSGIRADAIHGNKSQNARQRTLNDFKENRNSILVATDIAARGIDVDGISHVLNYDLPHEPETYIHRIGRTGRAGATGVAVSFCDEGERSQLRAIERLIRRSLPVERQSPGGGELSEIELMKTPSPDARRHARPRASGRYSEGRSRASASTAVATPKSQQPVGAGSGGRVAPKRRSGKPRHRRAL
jgi:ATP-dependent RNA helicase RhlE